MSAKIKVQDILESTVEDMLNALDSHDSKWRQTWFYSLANDKDFNHATGREYQGVNTVLLSFNRMVNGWKHPQWLTYNQCKAKGGQVQKGEKSSLVFFWSQFVPKDQKDLPKEDQRAIPVLRYYRVFNIEQTDLELPAIEAPKRASGIEFIDSWINSIPHKKAVGDPAYSPISDTVKMPPLENFHGKEEYYAAYFHELTHWSGGSKRLNRIESTDYHTLSYGKEELVAETGAGLLSVKHGLDIDVDNWLSYLKGFLSRFKGKNRGSVLMSALGQAEKAVNFLFELAEPVEKKESPEKPKKEKQPEKKEPKKTELVEVKKVLPTLKRLKRHDRADFNAYNALSDGSFVWTNGLAVVGNVKEKGLDFQTLEMNGTLREKQLPNPDFLYGRGIGSMNTETAAIEIEKAFYSVIKAFTKKDKAYALFFSDRIEIVCDDDTGLETSLTYRLSDSKGELLGACPIEYVKELQPKRISFQKTVDDSERLIFDGSYKAAFDKLDMCVSPLTEERVEALRA